MNGIQDAVAALQRGVVPPGLGWASVVNLLKAGKTIIFGEEDRGMWKVLMSAALLTKDTGFAADVDKDLMDRTGSAIKLFLAWIAKAEAARSSGQLGADVTLIQNIDQELRANYNTAVNAQNNDPLATVAFIMADATHLEKNPFTVVHQPTGPMQLDFWVLSHPNNGVLRLLHELFRGARVDGSPTNVSNILQVIFGPCYGGGNDIRTAKGNPEANFGGFVFAGVYGGAEKATAHLNKWLHAASDAPGADQLKLLAVPQVLRVGKLPNPSMFGDKVYTMPLGESFVHDGFVAQALKAIRSACDNAANSEDNRLNASLMAAYLDLNTEPGKMSALHVVVRGQLSSRARHMPSIHGKAATLYEVQPVSQQKVIYMYLEHAGRDQTAKGALVSTLFNMARASEEGVEISEDRDRRTCVVNGACFIKLSSYKYELFMKLVKAIDSATPVHIAGCIELSSEQAISAMVVGANCKVYTGSSPAGLIHALSQAGVNFTEIGSGGGAAGAALAADLEAMKQQAAASEQAAAERSEQLTAALRQVQDASAAEMRALRAKVAEGQEQAANLRGDLGRAYSLMEANQRAAAAQADLNARRSEVAQATMMQSLNQMQQAHSAQATVLMSLLQSDPKAVLALRQAPALEGASAPRVVVGTNANGSPVFDANALIARVGPRQGGQAAEPQSAEVRAAMEAEEAAVSEWHDAAEDQRSAWKRAHGQGTPEHDDSNDMQDDAPPGKPLYLGSDCMVGGHLSSRGCMGGFNMDGGNGDFAFSWLPIHGRRQLSSWAAADARRREWRILHGTPMLGMVWAVIVVYALLRRMWRQLGRQFASVHKARRRKVAVAARSRAASEGVGRGGRDGNTTNTVAAPTMGLIGYWTAHLLSLCLALAMQHNIRFWVTVTPSPLGTCNRSVTDARDCCSCNSGPFCLVAGVGNFLSGWHGTTTSTTGTWAPSVGVGSDVTAHGEAVTEPCGRARLGVGPLEKRSQGATVDEWPVVRASGVMACAEWTAAEAHLTLLAVRQVLGNRHTRRATKLAWWMVQGGAPPLERSVHRSDSASRVSTTTLGERWRCGGPEGKAGPEVDEGGPSRGTPGRSARHLRWTCCTGATDPDDHCCAPTPLGWGGLGQDKWRGVAGGTFLGCIMPGHMILAMGTLIVCISRDARAGKRRGPRRLSWRRRGGRGRGGREEASRRDTQRAALYRLPASSSMVVLVLVAMQVAGAEAAGEDLRERVMLFNTRGLAVSTATAVVAGAAYFFAAAAMDKLAFIDTMLSTKRVDAGVLLELICDLKQARYLSGWFRKRGYGLRVASGEASEGRKGVRNSVAVFYRLRKFKEARGDVVGKYKRCSSDRQAGAATKLGERVLRVCLQRADRSVLNLIAWHGCHDEARFAAQMEILSDVAGSGCSAMVLGDVNRRLSMSHASRTNVLGAGDKLWARFVGWKEQDGSNGTNGGEMVRMIPMLDESEAAATRRAVVNGSVQWSILDRGVEMGGERGRWQLDEIVRPEAGGTEACEVSDHAAVCFERIAQRHGDGGDPKPKIPGVRRWSAEQHKRYGQLTKGLEERAREACGDNMEEFVGMMDAEMLGAAELVDVEEEERQGRRWRSDHDNCSIREKWRWRLRRLLDMGACKGAVRRQAWILHPKCELRHDARYFDGVDRGSELLWTALVRRCRRELVFYTRLCSEDAARATKLMQRVAAAESEEDPLARAKLAFEMMRGRHEPSEKVAVVAVGDDPTAGFVTDPEGVRREAAAIGNAAQEEYRDGNKSPEGAFEAFMEHFMESFEELRAPGGEEFDLKALLTFDLFEAELFAHARYKAVGAKVGRALSSLELIRRLCRSSRKAYFEVAKRCILEGTLPEHWQRMVYVLLSKKHGDQRKIRKKREIALMDQTLKLMLKCAKRLSFDRMVGRTGEDNHGWVPGHGALNAALMMDIALGQARELRHSIFILFLDLKQFFPAIKRARRTAAEYLLGLPKEVVRLAKAVFERMTARFDTAHGLSDSFDILGGDLMGCVLSPSHARCLLTSISVAVAAVSSGVRVWGCDKRVRQVAQTMMADDWAGFSTTEESLHAQWTVWVDYAMASGSPIGVAGLEKTVVTAARFENGKWVDIPVKLRVPTGAGGFDDLPGILPQMAFRDAYPHMGILRSIGGSRQHMRNKLKKGVAALVSKVRKVKFDKGQHISCANCLKGSYVGYYAAAYGLTMAEAEELERIWRAVFRMVFKVQQNTPAAHFYGGAVDRVADSLHGRHVIVDAVGSLYSTCRRALASPEDSSERALARSALARRARRWGCTCSPVEWLGSRAHLDTAVVMESEMESGRVTVEAFDFFILYTAWLTRHDGDIYQERAARGEKPAPLRDVLTLEHVQDEWGEALLHNDHAAWASGESKTLQEALGRAAPASLLLAGITRVEHVCKPSAMGGTFDFVFLTFAEASKLWELPKSTRVQREYDTTIERLHSEYQNTEPWFSGHSVMVRPMVRPRTSRQLWEGVRLVGWNTEAQSGWPVGGGRRTVRGDGAFAALLRHARATGESVSRERWVAAMEGSYPGVVRQEAREWWDGAPRDRDRYGTILVHAWPGAEHREGGDRRTFGRRALSRELVAGEEGRRAQAARWSVGGKGELLIDGREAGDGEADGVPCVRLLLHATAALKGDAQAEVDNAREATIRSAGQWAVHVESTRHILEEWKELHATYDIQVAASTDGGWQWNAEQCRPMASAAVYHDDGTTGGGALDPWLYPSSYECELRALVDAVRAWPAGSRALLAVDARSPVMAVTKFREAHVNKRAEYYRDGMLDELLVELERMDLVVFYWLKGHSGAVPNEIADLRATTMLEDDPRVEAPVQPRRHASLTFAFDRRPFRWASERMTRHVNALLRDRSSRSEWRGVGDWELQWGRGRAALKKTLHRAQTRRLFLGDVASYEGECGERARAVKCRCGHGPFSAEHWLFDCCLPAAKEQRAGLIERLDDVNFTLAVLDGGRQHEATANALAVLRGQEGAEAEKRHRAFRWLVGCIPKPRVSNKTVRKMVMQAVSASGRSLQGAAVEHRPLKELFLAAERERALALKVYTRLREWAVLSGPGAAGSLTSERRAMIRSAPKGPGTALGGLGAHYTWRQAVAAVEGEWVRRRANPSDWIQCAREWGAALTLLYAVRRWATERRGRGPDVNGEALSVWRRWGQAVARCPDQLAAQRKSQAVAASLARKAKARRAERDAAHFQMVMGVEGEGNITLAPGLEDVEVAFRRRRRVNWRPTGRRNRRRGRHTGARSGGSDVDNASSASEGRGSDSDLESSGDEDGGGPGDADSDFETEAGDDGNSGEGNDHGVVVGDMLRVRWVAEQVWFRCRVDGVGRGGHTVRVTYLVDDRWGTFVHALSEVEWERWAPGGEVDPAEADYDMDVWVPDEEVDSEAAAAAAEGSRWRVESQGGDREAASRECRGSVRRRADSGDESEGEEDTGGAGTAGGGGMASSSAVHAREGRFEWVVKAAPKGKGLQKRKRLLTALVELWGAAPEADEDDLPVAMKRAVYKAMAGVMTPKQVAVELGILAKAGVVTVSGDEVRCSEAREGARAATAGPTVSTQAVAAERRKRRRADARYAESEQESEESEEADWD